MNSTRARRPAGATVLCVLLAWASAAGFLNAAVWRAIPPEMLAKLDASWIHSPVFVALALAYGASALAAAIGLWRMRSWAYPAICVWAAVIIAGGGLLFWVDPDSSLVGGILVAAPTLLLLGAGILYVRKVVAGPEIERSNNALERTRGE